MPSTWCDLPEVLGTQAVEGGAVQLGGAAHEIVDLGLEGGAVAVVPGVLRDVPPVDEHVVGRPVLGLPGQEVAPLEQEHLFARRGQGVGQGPSAGSGSDDDDVERFGHQISFRRGRVVTSTATVGRGPAPARGRCARRPLGRSGPRPLMRARPVGAGARSTLPRPLGPFRSAEIGHVRHREQHRLDLSLDRSGRLRSPPVWAVLNCRSARPRPIIDRSHLSMVDEPIAEAGEEGQVDEHPHHPAGKPAEMDALHAHDGPEPADGGDAAESR